MDLDSWLHLLHVLAAMVWVGGGITLSVMALHARSAPDSQPIAAFARLLPYVGIRVLMPSVVIVLISGVWMVLAGTEFTFNQAWVRVGLGLFAVAFIVGAVYMSRIGIQLDRAARGEPGAAQLRGLLDRWIAGYAVVLVILILAVWDMVVKPGL